MDLHKYSIIQQYEENLKKIIEAKISFRLIQ